MKFIGLSLLPLLSVCSLNTDSFNHVHVCFDLKPMPDFDINKFIGVWYGVVTSVRPSQCIVYEFSHGLSRYTTETGRNTGDLRDDEEPEAYKHFFIGELTVDPELPSAMGHFFLPGDMFRASYVVFDTDYVNFAAVYSCQKSSAGRRHTVTILSRTETLDELTIAKVKKSIHSNGYNMGLLKTVDHSGCKHRYLKFNDNKIYSYVNFQTNEVFPKEQLPKWML